MRKLFIALSLLATLSVSSFAQGLFSGGAGTKADPYQIANEADLRALSEKVRINDYDMFEGKYFLQTADITLSDEFFTPIGGLSEELGLGAGVSFNGTYDGGMKKIKNLKIYDETQLFSRGGAQVWSCVGLFGAIGSGALIKNVVIASGDIYGFLHVGAIVGWMKEDSKVEQCKVARDVYTNGRCFVGGIVGSPLANTEIIKCVNYGTVKAEGAGAMVGSVAGIVGGASNTKVEACANFGDVINKGQVAGAGIVSSTPLDVGGNTLINYTYPPMLSCMNIGNVTSREAPSGGLLGTSGYQINAANAQTIVLAKNSYVSGQCYTDREPVTDQPVSPPKLLGQFGPIVAVIKLTSPQKVERTFYDADRFYYKKDVRSADSEIAFKLGEAKSHAEMRTPEFLATLNKDAKYLYEEDKHNINFGMPVLKWINDTFDAEIDKPNYLGDFNKPIVTKMKAGTLFRANRAGDFIMINNDVQSPNIQMKMFGFTKINPFVKRVLPVAGEKDYTYFMSTSRFNRPFTADGSWSDRSVKPAAADRWFITPEFEVTKEQCYIHWQSASEEKNQPFLEGYDVYIGGEDAVLPKDYKAEDKVLTVENEAGLKLIPETVDDHAHYELTDHTLDLKKYMGKKVRIALHHNAHYKFLLLFGKFTVDGNPTGVTEVASVQEFSVRTVGTQIEATTEESGVVFTLYDLAGHRLATAQNALVYKANKGVYILKATNAKGGVTIQKIVL